MIQTLSTRNQTYSFTVDAARSHSRPISRQSTGPH